MFERLLQLNIKSRIRIGAATFFLLVLVVGAMGMYYLNRVKSDSESIFTTNYAMLVKCQDFGKVAGEFRVDWLSYASGLDNSHTAVKKLYSHFYDFDSIMIEQLHLAKEPALTLMVSNIESGLDAFRKDFKTVKFAGASDTLQLSRLFLGHLKKITGANEKLVTHLETDIQGKYEKTNDTVSRAITYMALVASTFSIISLLLLWLIPSYITNPIHEFVERFRNIGNKDFSQKMVASTGDEFGILAEAFNHMTLRLDEFERMNISEVVREKQRIETIIDNLTDPILVCDEQNLVIWMNGPAEELFGLQKQEMLGLNLADVKPLNFKQEVLLHNNSQQAAMFNFSAEINGRVKYFHKEEIKVGESHIYEDQHPAGKVLIFYDITSFKELDLAKTNFMATLSHQFKTPISATNISLQLLGNPKLGTLNAEQQKLVETLQAQNDRLLRMVNELLDLGQIETGKINLKKVLSEPRKLADHSLKTIDAILTSRKVQVSVEESEALPKVQVDPEKITWVLNNLLTNAARYSQPGDKLVLALETTDAAVMFSVTDQGPGIPAEMREKIFEKYERSAFDKTKGTGLGLAIAREVIEAHGGTIGVHSEPGQGSTFYFTLPAALS